MLLVTGQIKGKNYQDESMSPEDFLDLFGMTVPDRKELIVQYKEVPPGPSNGSSLVSPGKHIVAGATAMYNGRPLFIRYASSSKPNSKNPLVKDFEPRKIKIRHDMIIYKEEDLEMFCFMLVSPQNDGSPLKGATTMFKIIDPGKVSKAKLENIKSAAQIYSIIDSMSLEELRIKAYGLRIDDGRGSTRGVSISQEMTIDEVKVSLYEAAENNKQAFMDAWGRKEIEARGTLAMLMARGLIVEHINNGTTTISWNGVNGSSMIMQVTGKQDPVDALLAHYLQPANTQRLIDQIKSASGELQLAEGLRMPGVDASLAAITRNSNELSLQKLRTDVDKFEILQGLSRAALVTFAIDNEILWPDITTKKVFFVKKSKPDGIFYDGTKAQLAAAINNSDDLYNQLYDHVKAIIS